MLPVLQWRLAPRRSAAGCVEDGAEEEDEDEAPLALEALMCTPDARHQGAGVQLLHTLLESPQASIVRRVVAWWFLGCVCAAWRAVRR